ncbi:MAG: DUF1559 domain-containing protein [Planctomycetota bacterium]
MTTRQQRRGVSLIDLVAVTACVVMLVSIVLVATQSTREVARRTFCASNLRQLGLGLLAHHDAKQSLPPSSGGPDSTCSWMTGSPPALKPHPGPGFGRASGFVMLLPFIDQVAIYQAIEAAGWPAIDDPLYRSFRIGALLCPSDPASRQHSYLFSIGDRTAGLMPAGGPPAPVNGGFQAGLRGLFGLHSSVRLASVRDGLSSTIAMSESVTPTGLGRVVPPTEVVDGVTYVLSGDEAVVNERFAMAYGCAGSPAGVSVPLGCLASFDGARFREGAVLMPRNRGPGWAWADGRPSYISFATVLPPNGPRCGHFSAAGVLTAQSRHIGGVMGLMADGAVRFVADHIDSGDRQPAVTRCPRGSAPCRPRLSAELWLQAAR